MNELILAIALEIMELVFCFALGMAVLPCSFLEQEDRRREVYFLLAPVTGFSVWLLAINFFSLTIQFNLEMSLAVFAILIGWIIYKRKNLFFLWNRYYLSFIGLAVIFSVFVIWGCQNPIIDGGIYFAPAAYDHSRIAIADSIARNGFPLYSPWVADNGNLIPIGYHFGIHTLIAQLIVVLGMDSLQLSASVAGVISTVSLLAIGAAALKMIKQKAVLFLVILLSVSDAWHKGIWQEIVEACVNNPETFGFWSFMDNALWCPHHIIGGAMVLAVIILVYDRFEAADSEETLRMALLVGAITSASTYCSAYAGGFAGLFFAITLLGMSIFDRTLRRKLLEDKSFCALAVFVAIAFTSVYMLYLTQSSTEGATGLGFGLMPSFTDEVKQMNVLLLIGMTYFVLLPLRIGLGYTIGFISCLLPRVMPQTQFVRLCKYYVFFTLAVSFVLHSTLYSNDFGWRMPMVSFYLLFSFSAIGLYKLCAWLREKTLIAACLPVVAVLAANLYFMDWTLNQLYFERDFKHKLHQEYADVIKGWKVVQDNTGKNDLVLSNPNAYAMLHPGFGAVPNLHFSYYAKRYSPMGDHAYAITSGARLGADRLQRLRQTVTSFFAGNPTAEETDYIVDVQKVKALLVTPQDGLYYHEGALRSRYPRLIEGKNFKVYLTE